MPFFNLTDFDVFNESAASSPDGDLERVRLRDRLVELHEQVYPEMRARRWDLHPHWVPRYLVSSARLEPPVTQIRFLLLRYGKAETVVRMMKKELGEDFSHPYHTALLGARLDERGLGIEVLLTERAKADAENFKNKLLQGAPEKKHFRQLLADLGSDYALTLESALSQEFVHMRCSRLVNLGTLDWVLDRFQPGTHQLRVAIRYAPDDLQLAADALPAEVLARFGQLYLLYQYMSWSPRNDFLSPARPWRADRDEHAAPQDTGEGPGRSKPGRTEFNK